MAKSSGIQRESAQCFMCGDRQNLNEHHIDWNRSHNRPENKVALCQRCHSICHNSGVNNIKEIRDMRRAVERAAPDRFKPRSGSNELDELGSVGDR
ncbi:MAG: hypothetical protein ABIU97_10490, partial [Dehalococcoidia bacterium]